MLITFISWIYIATVSFICGFGVLKLLERRPHSLEFYFIFGLCFITVYAQFFSLFYKVGLLANIGLLLICGVIILFLHKDIFDYLNHMFCKLRPSHICIIALIGGITLSVASGFPKHYDTDLYHAQAIRWIEDYGVVKGLGNLHNRFAYNSSFFCLQALFGLKFVFGYSLHSLNGLITFVMLTYAVTTLSVFHKKPISPADILKLAFFYYAFQPQTYYCISSPGSDCLAMFMILYLSAKWLETAWEKSSLSINNYCFLSILALWTVTIKLSAVTMVLLVISPIIYLIQEKKWNPLGKYTFVGAIVMIPFIIRNVIISGYLLYPYPSIDFFSFDWKMPSSIASFDSLEIKAWGRGLRNIDDYSAPFSVWFPDWYHNLSTTFRFLLIANILLLLMGFIICLYYLRKKKSRSAKKALKTKRDSLSLWIYLISSTLGLLFWLFTAPLIRYGVVFLLIIPCFYIGILLTKLSKGAYVFSFCLFAIIALAPGITTVRSYYYAYGRSPLITPNDYQDRDYNSVSWEGIELYLPVGSDCIGYHHFPSTTSVEKLENLRLRTGDLRDGFQSIMTVNSD